MPEIRIPGGIDHDPCVTWPQLIDRLREIRKWAQENDCAEVLAILDRPRETI